MAFLTPLKEEEIIGELILVAQLLDLEVVEYTRFPSVMVRVSRNGTAAVLTKQGSDYLSTDTLPDVPMTFIGGGMFSYRLEV
jgi:hypothetical protein